MNSSNRRVALPRRDASRPGPPDHARSVRKRKRSRPPCPSRKGTTATRRDPFGWNAGGDFLPKRSKFAPHPSSYGKRDWVYPVYHSLPSTHPPRHSAPAVPPPHPPRNNAPVQPAAPRRHASSSPSPAAPAPAPSPGPPSEWSNAIMQRDNSRKTSQLREYRGYRRYTELSAHPAHRGASYD